MTASSFYEVLTEAVRDFVVHGYDDAERLAYWTTRLRDAVRTQLISETELKRLLDGNLRQVFKRLVEDGSILTKHPGVARFTLERVKPKLRDELDRRILASADLIRSNREQALETTLRRFQGWATSIPVGGSGAVDKRETKVDLRKALGSLPFAERRVAIDQGHKLAANLSAILAKDGGALAGRWRSHWRQANYDYRPDHKERDGLTYAVRGNWAMSDGLMRVGPAGYYDEITPAASEPYCRCWVEWLHHLRQLPPDMVTQRGQDELARVRALIA